MGVILPLRRQLTISGDIFPCHDGVGGWHGHLVEVRDTAKHATMPRTAPTSTPVSTAEVEKRGYNPKGAFSLPRHPSRRGTAVVTDMAHTCRCQ